MPSATPTGRMSRSRLQRGAAADRVRVRDDGVGFDPVDRDGDVCERVTSASLHCASAPRPSVAR